MALPPIRHRGISTRAIRSCALGAVAAWCLGACDAGVLDPQGPVAGAQRTILLDSLVIMLAIVVPTIVATLAFAWWFRASNTRATYRPTWAYSGRIELVVWSIPALVVVLLGGVIWIGSHRLDPARPLDGDQAPLDIQVVSLDWKWLFIYPGQRVAALNQLVVPVGRPLRFSLTSASVLNTLFIPQLGSMIYTMNGMVTTLHLQADQAGVFRGLSGHYSGAGFSDMHFQVRAVAPAAFDDWVAATRSGGRALDAAVYLGLTRQSTADPPATYGAVQAGLFDRIVMQLPPGPGPAPGPLQSGTAAGRQTQGAVCGAS